MSDQTNDSDQAPPAATMPPAVIDPNAVFTPEQLQALLQLNPSSIRREVRLGRLRASLRLGKLWLLGEWVLKWLRDGEVKPGRRRGAAGGPPPPKSGRNGAAHQN